MRSAAIILSMAMAACSPTKESTYVAHGADIATTGIGFMLGAAEANPLGIVALPIKIAATEYADSLPPENRPYAHSIIQSITWAAVANNVCAIVGLATGGVMTPLCIALGLGTGFIYWESSEEARGRAWFIIKCAEFREVNPDMKCDWHGEQL